MGSIHFSYRTLKVMHEISRIGERPNDPIANWTVRIVFDLPFKVLNGLLTTPRMSIGYKKYLFGRVLLEAGKSRLPAVEGHVVFIGSKSFS